MDGILSFINEIPVSIDFTLVVALLGFGAVFKHTTPLEKISNAWLPLVLLVLGVAYSVLVNGATGESIAGGIIAAAVAVYLHQAGKNIFYAVQEKKEAKEEEPKVIEETTEVSEEQ